MNARISRTLALALLTAAAAAPAHAQVFFFDSGTDWLGRNSTNSNDISFLGANNSNTQYSFRDGTLTAYQLGGSLFNPFDGRVRFTVTNTPPGLGDDAPFGRVATGFNWSTSGSEGYVWSNIPANRTGSMTGNNPAAGTYFASKVGDQFQMQVHASNNLTTSGRANAQAAVRDAPIVTRSGGFNNSMTNLNLLDLDPARPGVQINPGDIPVHLNIDAATGSRAKLDFSALGWGDMASPFKDTLVRRGDFYLGSGAEVRFDELIGGDTATWNPYDGTLNKSLGQVPIDRLLSFTAADVGKTFTLHFGVTLDHGAYDADGGFLGYSDRGTYNQNYSIEVIPTPGTAALGGLAALALARRRRRA